MNNEPNKILIIQTAYIGDVVFTTPLIREVKQQWSKAHLTVLVAPRGELVLVNNSHIDELLVFDKQGIDKGMGGLWRWIKLLREKRFDLVITPHRSWRSAILSWGTGAKQKVGFRKGLGWLVYRPSVPYRVKQEPRYVERKLNLLRALEGNPSSSQVEMFVGKDERAEVAKIIEAERIGDKPLVALNPGSQWATKRWVLDYYLDLGSRIGRELGWQVILMGAPSEKDMLGWLEQRMNPKPLNRVGDSLRMAAAWLERCTAYVGGDTGPTYMAVAVGTKHVIALYGPTPENVFDFREGDAVLFKEGLRCRPCSPHGPRKCPIGTLECQTGIWVGKVFNGVKREMEITTL